MAKTIATISGIALRPGVSKNNRWYKPEHVAGAVTRAQERIAAGQAPMAMLTFHGADDNSREITASLTGMSLEEDGSARFKAGITDTAAGRDIASLLDTSDGKPPHLRTVSIRGYWTGKVRKETGPDGKQVETADGIELDGVDFTKSPGVTGAQVDQFSWSAGGARETAERVLITESVEDMAVLAEEIPAGATEAVPAPPVGLREALDLFLGEPVDEDVEEGATPPMSRRGSGTQGSGRVWADPGYQRDKKQRYDITTKAVALTAWRYINQKSKAAKYTPAQLKRIKGRIKAALGKFGVTVSSEHAPGWGFSEAVQVSAEALEYLGMPASQSGSWSVSASNGPVNLSLSSYCMDPADLNVILRAAADAACKALAALDPDMDGDVDVPGADSGDTDGDADGARGGVPGTSNDGYQSAPAPEQPALEDAVEVAGDESPAEAGTTEQEDAGMATDTSTETGGAAQPGVTLDQVRETAAQAAATAVTAALEADRKARKEAKEAARAKAAKKAAKEAAATGTAPATTETAEDGDARIARLVAEALKPHLPAAPEPVAETEEQKVTRIVQGLIAGGTVPVGRKGAATAEGGTPGGDGTLNEHGLPSSWPNKPLHEFTPDEMKQFCAPVLDEMIFGGRTDARGRSLSVLNVPS